MLMKWGMWPELQGSMKQTNKMSVLVEAGDFSGLGVGGREKQDALGQM